MDFLNYFSRNQHIRNYKKRYSDFKEENHCRPVLLLRICLAAGRFLSDQMMILSRRFCERIFWKRKQFPAIIDDRLDDTNLNMWARFIFVENDVVLFAQSFCVYYSVNTFRLNLVDFSADI